MGHIYQHARVRKADDQDVENLTKRKWKHNAIGLPSGVIFTRDLLEKLAKPFPTVSETSYIPLYSFIHSISVSPLL